MEENYFSRKVSLFEHALKQIQILRNRKKFDFFFLESSPKKSFLCRVGMKFISSECKSGQRLSIAFYVESTNENTTPGYKFEANSFGLRSKLD